MFHFIWIVEDSTILLRCGTQRFTGGGHCVSFKPDNPPSSFLFSDRCHWKKAIDRERAIVPGLITLIEGTKLTCWLLLSLWLSFPPKRPSAAPGHPEGCWGPNMNVGDTCLVLTSRGREHNAWDFPLGETTHRVHAKILPLVHSTELLWHSRTERGRKGSDTYTHCKLKIKRKREGGEKIQKIKVVTVKVSRRTSKRAS